MFWSSRARRRLYRVLLSLAVALAIAEGTIRVSGVDWRYVEKNLYYARVDLFSYVADPDPNLTFRLKPGSSERYLGPFGWYRVTVNSLGARSAERPLAKPAGAFRVVCLGGSNVFGAMVNDQETWPAQLETSLNQVASQRCEVWNFGTSAYIGLQMATLGREVVQRFKPDLVIVAPSNTTPIGFLWGAPVAPYFARRPDYWDRLLPVATRSSFRRTLNRWFMGHVAIYRYTRLARAEAHRTNDQAFWMDAGNQFRAESARTLGSFLRESREKVRTCVILGPFMELFQHQARPIVNGLNSFAGVTAPTLVLNADDLPDEYRQIHPPAKVLGWYGEQIAKWLIDQRLVPGKVSVNERVGAGN